MATKKTTIGRTPTFAGAWVNNYVNPKTGHNGYPLKKRVSHLGSEFQSLIEDNTYEPATLNQAHTEITFDTEHWEVVSNGSDAYLLQYTVENKMDEVDARLDEQDEKVEMLNGSDVVVGVLPVSGETNKIYRVPNDPTAGKYTDYGWNGTQFVPLCTYPNDVDDEPTAGSDNLVKSGGVQNELALGAVYDVSAKNPTAGPNNDGKWESLSALLSDANLNTLIPTAVRKGGMSIKFVCSSDNKYVSYRETATSFSTDTDDWALCSDSVLVDNPEFIDVKTDKDGKILWAIKVDGSIYWGAGVPQQVIDYIEEKIAELSLDEYEDIVAFLNGLEEGDKTLQTLLDEKVDKEEGKSLIDADYADGVSQIENPEFAEVHTDADGKVLYGVKQDGDFYFGAGVPSQVQEELDNKADLDDFVEVAEGVANKVDKEEGKSLINADYASSQSVVDNTEYLQVTTDRDNKILAGRTTDGEAFENVGFSTPKISIDGHTMENIEDPEGRSEITTDPEGKIISYRDADGVKHEEVGIKAYHAEFDNLKLNGNAELEIQKITKPVSEDVLYKSEIVKHHVPKYGIINMLSEKFYLTKHNGYQDATGIYAIQLYPDTVENALNRVTLSYYYVKNTLTDNGDGTYSVNENSIKLDFYVKKQITDLNGNLYVTATLTEIVDPETGDVTYEVNENSIEVTEVTDVPNVMTWPVNKSDEHLCVVTFDFGSYLNGNKYIGVKYQGNSTLGNRKRNFRFTFYKNSTYAKKDKIKIGDMIRQSRFNLKSNGTDSGRFKEPLIYRILDAVWKERPSLCSYPWQTTKEDLYTNATGIIQGFPIRVNIGEKFYGIYIFGLKKDKDNYMLSDDADGMIVCGDRNNGNCWIEASPNDWSDEMNDDMTQSNINALNAFFSFINSENFDEENIPEHMSVVDWIDYFIFIQVFFARDNTCRNMILYSDSAKTKMYPFPYDLDLCLGLNDENYTFNILENSYAGDVSLWLNFIDIYWDKIVNRYAELRNKVLSIEYIRTMYDDLIESVPTEDIAKENAKWGSVSLSVMDSKLSYLDKRLEFLDKNYFKI